MIYIPFSLLAVPRHILIFLSFFIIHHKKSPKDDVIPNQFEKGVVIAKKHNALWDQLVPKLKSMVNYKKLTVSKGLFRLLSKLVFTNHSLVQTYQCVDHVKLTCCAKTSPLWTINSILRSRLGSLNTLKEI